MKNKESIYTTIKSNNEQAAKEAVINCKKEDRWLCMYDAHEMVK